MRILVVSSHKGGIHYHRQVVPKDNLREEYGCIIGFANIENVLSFYKKSKWDIIWWSVIAPMDEFAIKKFFTLFRKLGSKVVVDIDDSWHRDEDILYNTTKHSEDLYIWSTESSISSADLVTTTTKRLSEYIKPLNDNVVVLPNAINSKEPQWKVVDRNIDMTFGYLGSTKHERDLRLVNYNFKENGKECLVALKEYEDIIGATKVSELKDIDTYGTMYDEIDISIAPLVDTHFSRMKSPLKLVEAGFKKKAVICQEIPPYTDHTDLIEHCLTVPVNGSWKDAIESLTPEKVKEMAEGLHKVATENYNISKVNEKRYETFKLLSKQ